MFLCIFRRKVLSLINFYLTLCTYKRILLFTLLNKIYLVSISLHQAEAEENADISWDVNQRIAFIFINNVQRRSCDWDYGKHKTI